MFPGHLPASLLRLVPFAACAADFGESRVSLKGLSRTDFCEPLGSQDSQYKSVSLSVSFDDL